MPNSGQAAKTHSDIIKLHLNESRFIYIIHMILLLRCDRKHFYDFFPTTEQKLVW